MRLYFELLSADSSDYISAEAIRQHMLSSSISQYMIVQGSSPFTKEEEGVSERHDGIDEKVK